MTDTPTPEQHWLNAELDAFDMIRAILANDAVGSEVTRLGARDQAELSKALAFICVEFLRCMEDPMTTLANLRELVLRQAAADHAAYAEEEK